MPWTSEDEERKLIRDELRRLGMRYEKMKLDLRSETAVLINNATYSTATNILSIMPTELNHYYLVNL